MLIMGIGNLVQSDDGFGVQVIKQLSRDAVCLPQNIELLDAGTSIVDQLQILLLADYLLCIDVVAGGGKPGTLYQFKPEDITYKKSRFHHAHKISIFDVLDMVELLNKKPLPTKIIAVEPENIDWGTQLSCTLQTKLTEVVAMIHDEITLFNNVNNS